MASNGTQEGRTASFKAGADLSSSQYCLVKLGTNPNEVVLATAAADAVIGVLIDPGTASGDRVTVGLLNAGGTFLVKASAAITKGALLRATTGGAAVTATQSTAGAQPTTVVVGRALNTVASANSLVEFMPFVQLY